MIAVARLNPLARVLAIAVAAALLMLGLSGCVALRADMSPTPSFSIDEPGLTTLGRGFSQAALRHPDQSGFRVLASGHEALVARGALAELAERSLDLQYYSVGDDPSSHLLLQRLLVAAERGVRVRVLLDDISPTARDFAARAVTAHQGIEVRLFNPFRSISTARLIRLGEFALDGPRLNRRMHNKAWIADNATAVFGSRNIGDEYFDLNELESFSDLDLLVAGPAVRQMSLAFDAYWNDASAVPIEVFVGAPVATERDAVRRAIHARAADCHESKPCQWLAETELREQLRGGHVPLIWASTRYFADAPNAQKVAVGSGIEHGYAGDDPAGARSKAELLIVSPYFVPDSHGILHLAQMSARGVRVAVLTNSLASTDSVAAHSGYQRRRDELVRGGVELYELRPLPGTKHRIRPRWGHASPTSLHAKLVVQDRERVVVGSLNQDPRSRLHNTESWMVIESVELASELATYFDARTEPDYVFRLDMQTTPSGPDVLVWHSAEQGEPVRHDTEPMAGVWLRLWRSVLGLLIPEHML